MKNTIIITIGIIGFIVLGYGAYVFFTPKQTSPTTAQNQTNVVINNTYPSTNSTYTPPTTTSTGEPMLRVAAGNGDTMVVRDFTKDKDAYKDPLNAGQQYLGYHFAEAASDTTATENPPYVIDYFSNGGYFNIVLYQEPLKATRQQAEQDLMSRLGVGQAELCNLKYTISAPNNVNQTYAGVDLRFSFCQGAVQLP